MSTWTHIAGVIRFDGLAGISKDPVLGNTVKYEDKEDAWDKCDVPMGSEGSLEYTIRRNPDPSCMALNVVTIFGDLRDYDDTDEVIAYFNRIVEGQMVRNGVFTVEVESGESRQFVYTDESWVELSCKATT